MICSDRYFAVCNSIGKVISVQKQARSIPPPKDNSLYSFIEVAGPLSKPSYRVGDALLPCKDYELTNLPLPCTLVVEGESYELTEAPIFEFDTPGEYRVLVKPDSVEYLNKEFIYNQEV